MPDCRAVLTIGTNVTLHCELDASHSWRGFNHFKSGVSWWKNKILGISANSKLVEEIKKQLEENGGD